MQHYAAIFFLDAPLLVWFFMFFFFGWAPPLDWVVMWNYPYPQIFSLIWSILKAKTYMQHFYKFMQQIWHSAARNFFFRWAPLLDWFVMCNYPYSQIFSLIQPIVEAKTYTQHFDNFMQQICSIMLQFFWGDEHPF